LKAVRLNVGTEGAYFDGTQWRTYPPAGEVGVFDDMHAASLVAAGRGAEVKAVPESPPVTRPAVQPPAEIRQPAAPPGRPSRRA
jgi:hypothetical protein